MSAHPADQPLDAETVRNGLAACEVVAASSGRPSERLLDAARGLAERCAHLLSPLRQKALAVLQRIGGQPAEEVDLQDLYDEPDGATEQADADSRRWRTEMDLLASRLSG